MNPQTLTLLVLADLHHMEGAADTPPKGNGDRIGGPLLLRKALQRLKHEGVQPDVLVLLGDVAGRETQGHTEEILVEVAAEARRTNLPVLAVPGNHDGDPALHAKIFGCSPGLHEVGGYGFLLFSDSYAPDDSATRGPEGLKLPEEAAAARPGLPLIALQHNPLHPPIDKPYPYLPTNAEAIRASYERAGVILSLSGHFHAGQSLHEEKGVLYGTAPAACDPPYVFLHVQLEGRSARVRQHALRCSVAGLCDAHCHTEYSYCGTSVTAAEDIALSRLLGVSRLGLVDHAFQLYFSREDAWSWRWQTDRAMVDRAWATGRGRMPEYRRRAESLRGEFAGVGLEVDLLDDGGLLLAPEDRAGWDVLIGAVHAMRGSPKYGATQAEVEQLFLRDTERLLQHPIDVLAHPFRYFRRGGLTHPVHLHKPVARMLAAAGVAAEVNYHINQPNIRFLEECLAQGVRIALGTDSHDIVEVGELQPHVNLLRQAGVKDEDLPRILFRPRR